MVTGFRTLVIFMETSRNQIHILVVFMAISCNRVSHPLVIFMETFFANICFFVGFVRVTMQMPTKGGSWNDQELIQTLSVQSKEVLTNTPVTEIRL